MFLRRITHYIVAEFLKVFLVMAAGMTVVMLIVVVAQTAIREGLGPTAVARLLPYLFPEALLFAIPGTTLFAACSVYGRMAATNEVVAVKSAGVSPMCLLWPTRILAVLISLGVVVLNDIAVSWGRSGGKRVVLNSVEQIAYGMLERKRSYSSRGLSISVKDVDGHKLIRPTVTVYEKNRVLPVICTAEEAELYTNSAESLLTVTLRNGRISRGPGLSMEFNDAQSFSVPLDMASHKGGGGTRLSDASLRVIPREIERQRGKIEELEQALAAEAAYQMMTGDFAALTDASWGDEHASLAFARYQLFRLQTEPWRRWANGFSCLAFVMVGAPLALWLRNADVITTFFMCFFPTLIVYYPLLAYGVDLAKSGDLPPYCVWIGNLVFFGIGYVLTRKMMRH